MMEDRFKERIRKAIIERPYAKYFVISFLAFFLFNILVNQSSALYLNPGSLVLWFAVGFFGLNILISFLVALNINLVVIRYKEVGGVSMKGGWFGFLGVVGGILGGSCPACFAGIFPALVGVFGVVLSLNSLPLHGLEIQIFSVVLLSISIGMFIRDPVCKIRIK
jgi:hypothetical protein